MAPESTITDMREAIRSNFKKEFRKSRSNKRAKDRISKKYVIVLQTGTASVILSWVFIISSLVVALSLAHLCSIAEALQISNFRVPAFVPSTLPMGQTPPDLAKPILFDCDYDYKPEEDARLTVKWFKNKEAEPFYQWLPELNVQNFADWIRPLVNESFISDPLDPMKRYRSLLVRRLSMNLTGQYTCLVSSLAGQDMRSSSLVVYQPPRSFRFEHRIFPVPSNTLAVASYYPPGWPMQSPPSSSASSSSFANMLKSANFEAPATRANGSPTQFRGLGQASSSWPLSPTQTGAQVVVRPANNNNQSAQQQQQQQQPDGNGKIVYTHDGRPIRRKSRQTAKPLIDPLVQQQAQLMPPTISNWMLQQRRADQSLSADQQQNHLVSGLQNTPQQYAIQLHHFQCHASQVTPRPVLVLTVKREANSIAQYLHESSSVSIRPYQVSIPADARVAHDSTGSDYKTQVSSGGGSSSQQQQQLVVTMYDITVSATIALNVTLAGQHYSTSGAEYSSLVGGASLPAVQVAGLNTVLSFRRGQRMSFECHLEITGTEFEQRKRININEEEVYQFAANEEQRRRSRLRQQYHEQQMNPLQNGEQQLGNYEQQPTSLLADLIGSSQRNGVGSLKRCFGAHLYNLWPLSIAIAISAWLSYVFSANRNNAL